MFENLHFQQPDIKVNTDVQCTGWTSHKNYIIENITIKEQCRCSVSWLLHVEIVTGHGMQCMRQTESIYYWVVGLSAIVMLIMSTIQISPYYAIIGLKFKFSLASPSCLLPSSSCYFWASKWGWFLNKILHLFCPKLILFWFGACILEALAQPSM